MEEQRITQPKRRRPNQARSRDKLELIFEASIRILNKQGLEGFTTNRIAEVAGVSIGTLYQYFSNKHEILSALGQREIETTRSRIAVQMFEPSKDHDHLRVLVHNLLNVFDGRHRVRKILLELALSQQGLQGLDQPVQQIMTLINSPVARHYFNDLKQLTETDLFILSSAFAGIIRSSLVHDLDRMSRQELEDKIVLLIRSYVSQVMIAYPDQAAERMMESTPNICAR